MHLPPLPLSYPPARRDDEADPYRWLEAQDAPDTKAWVDEQNRLSQALLASLPGRDRFRELLREPSEARPIEAPVEAGGRFFSRWQVPGYPQPILMVQESPIGAPRPLVDPNRLSAEGAVSIDWWYASPSGGRLALGLSEASAEVSTLRIFDLASDKLLDDAIPGALYATVCWWPDESGLWYTRYDGPANSTPHGIYSHRLGSDFAQDPCLHRAPDASHFMWLVSSRESRYLAFLSGPGGFMKTIYMVEKDGSAPARLLKEIHEGRFLDIRVQGDRIFLLSTDEAPRGRVLTWDMGTSDAWQVWVSEQEAAVINLLPVGDRLILEVIRDAANHLVVHQDGRFVGEVPLPSLGDVASVSTGRWAVYMSPAEDRESFCFSFSSLLHPVSIYRYAFADGRLTPLSAVNGSLEPDEYAVQQVFYPSADGTRIPMFLVHRAGLEQTGDHPTLIHAYGGFGIAQAPGFNAFLHAWVAAGGVLAMPGVRGGGEYGEAWHSAGKRERKQNTFTDVITAAEWLVHQGYTSPAHLGFHGRSNGGLVAAAVLTQRPELFGAIVGRVPVTDMLRFHVMSSAGRGQLDEFGDPDDPAMVPALKAYSPYHRVQPAVRYPAAFFLTAEHDLRVSAAHGFKLVAALQHAQAGDAPVLLQHAYGAGHGAGRPLTLDLEENVDVLAFLGWRLGI